MHFQEGRPARVAVIGSAGFASDLAAELGAAGIRGYEVIGWFGAAAPAAHSERARVPRHARRGSRGGDRAEGRAARLGSGGGRRAARRRRRGLRSVRPDRRCLPRPAGEDDRGEPAVRGAARPRAARDDRLRLVPLHDAPALPAHLAAVEAISDLAVALPAAIVALPLLAVAAIAIKLSDSGPVLFRQRRVGERGRDFNVLKLRTMVTDAEAAGPQWCSAERRSRDAPGQGCFAGPTSTSCRSSGTCSRGEMTLVGPAARAARDRHRARATLSALHAPPSRQARDHGLGPAAVRVCRVRARHRVEAVPRPVLCQAPVGARGLADHRRDPVRGGSRRSSGAPCAGKEVPCRRGQ